MAVERPAQIWIGAKPFSVIYDKDVLDRHNGRDRQDRIGRTDTRGLEITIDPTLAEQIIRDTLLHECLHAVWIDAGLDEMESLTEEQIVNTLTPRLVSMMRVNPELMDYMLRESGDSS
ncbi:hypothetical protein LCGC14_2299560 [marine sediment metagenome]|uniref:SprT-like domain-containing protein n=1 Tax=marine sediment metagenome TaxID=412755 RepID=A0A0F9F1A5_9ZZZZ